MVTTLLHACVCVIDRSSETGYESVRGKLCPVKDTKLTHMQHTHSCNYFHRCASWRTLALNRLVCVCESFGCSARELPETAVVLGSMCVCVCVCKLSEWTLSLSPSGERECQSKWEEGSALIATLLYFFALVLLVLQPHVFLQTGSDLIVPQLGGGCHGNKMVM